MRKIRNTVLALAVVSAVFILSGCTTFDNFTEAFFKEKGASADTVRIGVLQPQTGNDSSKGQLETKGIELAHEVIGKVLDKKVELVYADTQSSIYVTESAVQDLIDKKPAVVLGSYGEAVTMVASRGLGKAQIPAITMTSTNPLITVNNEYYFRVSFSDASQGNAIAKYVHESLKAESAAVVRMKGDESVTPLVSKFNRKLTTLTENENAVVTTVSIDANDLDYPTYVKQLKTSKTKVVFMPVSLMTAEQIFEEATKQKYYGATFIGPKEWHNDELIALQNKYPTIKMAVASDFSNNLSTTANYDTFIKAYEAKYGKQEPEEATALGFDAYMIAIQAISEARSIDGKLIQEALKNTVGFPGVSGEISFDETGEPSKPINMDVIRNSKFVSVYTVNSAMNIRKGEQKNGTEN